jgi:anaerobic magnesium-protoporphyrin IX monomethyl ester cyclase
VGLTSAERFVDRLEGTMKYINRTLSDEIQIVDDEFSMDPSRATEIACIIQERGLRPKIRYSSRATDILADGFIENIADITKSIFVGAECGYDEGLKYVGKGITCQIQEAAARKLEENEISEKAVFSFIIGLPWETRLEVEKTIHFALDLISNYGISAVIQWYMPIPGSHLWHMAHKAQLFNESMYDSYGFAHNSYLFRGGLKLKPKEIWDISDILMEHILAAKRDYPDQEKIIYTIPEAIIRNFPRDLLSEEGHELENLRELSRSIN